MLAYRSSRSNAAPRNPRRPHRSHTTPGRWLRGAGTMAVLLSAILLASCSNPALRDSDNLRQAGQHEAALARLQTASNAEPDNTALRGAYFKQRDITVAHLLYQAEASRAAGRREELQALLDRLDKTSPGHPRTVWLREELSRNDRQQRLMAEARTALNGNKWALAEASLRAILAETPGHAEARAMLATLDEQRTDETRQQTVLQLAGEGRPVTLEFRETPLKNVMEALAKAAGVNFVFDKDVRGESKVTLFLRDTSVDEALRVILNTQQLGHKLLNPNTVLIFPNTTQKQRDLLDTVTRSFYLVNADPKQVQTLIRTVAKTRDIHIDERLNLLIARDTPDVMRLIERLVASVDLPDPEVMLELEVMEVSSKRANDLGLSWPGSASYGIPGSTAALTSKSDLVWSISNPAAVAALRSTSDATNLLANPKIRARNREKAKVLLGEKLPVFTSNLVPGLSGAASTSVTYLDVGLKLEVEPQVQLDNEVIIKVALEVSSVTGKVETPDKASQAYQVGTRQATTSLRLKDGETQILAGLINDEETRNSAGLPFLHDLPVLGRLFGRGGDTRNKTEVVLLITPRVVRNLSLNNLAALPMASGTEAQPGAPAWLLSKGEAGNIAGQDGPDRRTRMAPRSRPLAAENTDAPQMTGPEEAMPGSNFQITVSNPGTTVLKTTLSYDSGLLTTEPGRPGGAGSVVIEVPSQGQQTITFSVKPGLPPSEATFSMDAPGTSTWTVRIRSPQDQPAPPSPE